MFALIATVKSVVINATVFLPLVFNNGAATQPAVIGELPDEPKHLVRYEAQSIAVMSDGSFTLTANDNVYGGCLETITWQGGYPEGAIPSECSQSTGATDGIELFEDGSAIWTVDTETEIEGCFLPDWGCSDNNSRSWLSRSR